MIVQMRLQSVEDVDCNTTREGSRSCSGPPPSSSRSSWRDGEIGQLGRFPPATEPTNIAAPLMTLPRPKALQCALVAGRGQCIDQPRLGGTQKNVNPRASTNKTAAHFQNGAFNHHRRTYSAVATASVR